MHCCAMKAGIRPWMARLIHEASRVLLAPTLSSHEEDGTSSNRGGLYILVSHQLPTSTRELLVEQGDLGGITVAV